MMGGLPMASSNPDAGAALAPDWAFSEWSQRCRLTGSDGGAWRLVGVPGASLNPPFPAEVGARAGAGAFVSAAVMAAAEGAALLLGSLTGEVVALLNCSTRVRLASRGMLRRSLA